MSFLGTHAYTHLEREREKNYLLREDNNASLRCCKLSNKSPVSGIDLLCFSCWSGGPIELPSNKGYCCCSMLPTRLEDKIQLLKVPLTWILKQRIQAGTDL